MEYKVEKISLDDIDTIYEMGCGVNDFSADGGENIFWPKKTLEKLFVSKDDVCLKLVVNEKVVGFSFTMIHKATMKAYLENFYVVSDYQYLTKEFLMFVEDEIKDKGAEFIMYFFDKEEDCNNLELFQDNDYFVGSDHLWLHKNICFDNKKK